MEPAAAVSQQVTYGALEQAAARHGLSVMGGHHPDDLADVQTLLLLGPAADFWDVFSASPEAQDGNPDPIDRWSARIIPLLGRQFGATPFLPFGGPPYAPFISWALASKRCRTSPVGMLVHDTQGLMISFRGAIGLPMHIEIPLTDTSLPCTGCTAQYCKSACPVSALSAQGYDTTACHNHLNTAEGQTCLQQGCIARRACPITPYRPPEQWAHHMSYFHKV